ncbi:hypothetical protein [Streptomyces sp. E-08]|uniref:hypothetical protein n=1 Tax=Streptomyces sp. E-08 TaxID=3404047 RepID=UPI003CF7D4CE
MTHNDLVEPTRASGDGTRLNPEIAATTHDVRGHGVFEQILDAPGFPGAGGMMLAGATEFSPVTGDPIMGSAVVTLHNVVPLNGARVQVRVEVKWPEDLSIRIQLFYLL